MEKQILVVDDSPTIRSSVSFCLRNAGYKVQEAKDGQDALDQLEEMKKNGEMPVLILTDINMPVMDGLTFISKVKETSFKYLPILVLTTESEKDVIAKGKKAGAAGWLIKPFHPEQLLWAIKKLIFTTAR
ncbi:MAG: response regulator [Deltaproteobacteria bacterium]|nr:response regulator [Deltaproteobacteria bacterium]